MSDDKIFNEIEEMAEPREEVSDRLDNPFVVHKKGDASYEEDTSAFEMNQTHSNDDEPTLERHRFRKDSKKKGSAFAVILVIIVICAGVFAGLYYTGSLPFNKDEESTSASDISETTTDIAEKYVGKIVIKGTYIFVDGVEVDGIQGLQNALKYEDASPTAYELIDEHANSDFLNNDVLVVLTQMGFFGDKTQVKHIESTGLMAAEELTTLPPVTEAETEAITEEVSE